MRWLSRLLRPLADRDGAAAIEFAFAAPVLFLALAGTLEMLMVLFVGSILESAVLDASRYGITGSTTPGISRADEVKAIIEDRTLGLVKANDANIETLVYPSFDSIGQPEPYTDTNANGSYDDGEPFTDINGNGTWDADMGAVGLGGPGDIVVYRVTYTWGMLTPLLAPIIGDVTHTAAVVVRNEPY